MPRWARRELAGGAGPPTGLLLCPRALGAVSDSLGPGAGGLLPRERGRNVSTSSNPTLAPYSLGDIRKVISPLSASFSVQWGYKYTEGKGVMEGIRRKDLIIK